MSVPGPADRRRPATARALGAQLSTRTSPAPAEAFARSTSRDGVVRAGIVLGMVALPILRPPALGNLGPADVGLLAGVVGVLLWAASSGQRLRSSYGWAVTVMAVAGLLAGLGSDQPGQGLLAVAQDLYLLAWAFACVNAAHTPDSAAVLVRAWCLAGFGWGVLLFAVVGSSVLTAKSGDTRLAFTADSNGAGFYFVVSIFVIAAARWPRRVGLRWVAIGFLLVDTVLTGSLGALSGLLAGLALTVVLTVLAREGPAPAIAVTLALLLGSGSAALLAQQHSLTDAAHQSSNLLLRNSIGRGAQSAAEREQVNRETTALLATSGIIGNGPNTTAQVLRDRQAPYAKQAHNDWIAALVERGVLGLTGLLLLALEVVRRAARVWDPRRLDGAYARALPSPQFLVGGLATLLVFSLTHEVLHDRTAWTLLGVLAAFAIWGLRTPGVVGGGR